MKVVFTEKQKEIISELNKLSLSYNIRVVYLKVGHYSVDKEGLYIIARDIRGNTKVISTINKRTFSSLYEKKVFKKEQKAYIYIVTELESKNKFKELVSLRKKFENKEYSNFKERVALRKQIERLECEIKGLDYDEEVRKKNERINNNLLKQEKREKDSLERAKKLNKETKLEIPNVDKLKDTFYTTRLKRYDIDVYRGISENAVNGENNNFALYGQGLYTTTSRKTARLYGKVVEMTPDDLPIDPIRFKTDMDFNLFRQYLCEYWDIEIRHIHIVGEIDELFVKFGFDGMTLGDKKDMIIVKYI